MMCLCAMAAHGVEVLREDGLTDEYEAPTLPLCPDGREREFMAPASTPSPDEIPHVFPVSIHQVELEYYKQFPLRTEQEWDLFNARRRAEMM